jgi:LacI family transcriptional regulator
LQRGVDALVLSTAREGDSFPDELEARGIPFVLALRTDGKSLSSVADDRLGGYLATRHLIDLGHRRIGLIAGPAYASSSAGRVAGYREAMAEAGAAIDPAWITGASFSIDAGVEAADALMRLPEPPTAIFAVNDNTAIGAMSALRRLDLAIPDDVSLVGYNDIPIVSRLGTPMTTVRVPFDQIAAATLDLLTHGAEGAQRIRVATPTLIPRRSTAVAADK